VHRESVRHLYRRIHIELIRTGQHATKHRNVDSGALFAQQFQLIGFRASAALCAVGSKPQGRLPLGGRNVDDLLDL